MWLSDYKDAIAAMEKFMGNTCWTSISCSWDGSAFIFTAGDPDTTCWVWRRKENVIEHHYADTWRNPEHKEIYTLD